jgi:hypothetical protein
MRIWQPTEIHYPDAEQVMCEATRQLGLKVDFVGREVPRQITTAIIWNRDGAIDPKAFMRCRIFAPTQTQVSELTRQLAAKLPLIPKMRKGVTSVRQNTGPTDLGDNPGPMRQMMYDITLQGQIIT